MKPRIGHFSDAVALLACSLIICSLGLLTIRRQRALAIRSSCEGNLKKLTLALHNYHSAYKQLPMGSGGTDTGSEDQPTLGNAHRLSAFVGLTPFLEEQSLWEQIANPLRAGGTTYPAMGPVPWYDPQQYEPWGKRPAVYVCPADADAEEFSTAASYVLNYGDGVYDVGAPIDRVLEPYSLDRASKRGAFMREHRLRFRDFLDGLSNTLVFSEARIDTNVAWEVAGLPLNPSLCIAASNNPSTDFWPEGRQACWADGSLRSVGWQTILPPNSPSATSDKGELEGVMSASSHHAGGVHVGFADGNVRFVLDSIEAGDPSSPSVAGAQADGLAKPGSQSPYGLWGAIGTRASRERIKPSEDDNIVAPVRELSAAEKQELQAKPLESWTSADGQVSFKARQLEIKNRSTVILMTDEDEVKRIRLSELKSEDAFRAAQRDVKENREARDKLIAQLEEAVDLLSKERIVTFLDQFVQLPKRGPNKQQIAKLIEAQRDQFINQLELTVRNIRDPRAHRISNKGERTRLPGGLQVQYVDGNWKIVLY